MRVPWKIAVPISCIALISGAAVTWQVFRVRANRLKLAQDATVCRLRAEHGDAKAEASLGNMYSHGQGIPQDYAEALRWYRKAADHGDANGQDGLASMYSHGQGVPQDYAEALRWYRKAADQGDAKAENAIALVYSQGQGVPQDYAEALRWYRKAADQGYPKSQYNLGNMYYYGRGVPQDRAEAERWYHKAADQGNEYAQRALGLKGSGLSNRGAITLSAMFLGCLWVLKDSLLPQRSLRHRQPRALTMAGVCGVAYIGLSLYWDFGVFQSVLAVNAFYFFKNLVAGITIAMLISLLGPKSVKVILGISAILLVGNYLIVISHHELTRFATTIRGFSSVNGLLIGMAVPLAIFTVVRNDKKSQR
jgi:hypothetical protein